MAIKFDCPAMQNNPAGSQQEGGQLRELPALRRPLLGAQGRAVGRFLDGGDGWHGRVARVAGEHWQDASATRRAGNSGDLAVGAADASVAVDAAGSAGAASVPGAARGDRLEVVSAGAAAGRGTPANCRQAGWHWRLASVAGDHWQDASATRAAPAMAAVAPAAAVRLATPPPRVARLISADAAESALKPSADGRLPDLQLQEGIGTAEADAPAKSTHPAVLFAVLALSVVISVVLAMVSFSPSDSIDSEQQNAARQFIEENYFGGGNIDRGELQPYQIYLREAKRAHSNGDLKTEKARYRKVLDLLRGDRGEGGRGLTGSRTDDAKLEDQIGVILRGE